MSGETDIEKKRLIFIIAFMVVVIIISIILSIIGANNNKNDISETNNTENEIEEDIASNSINELNQTVNEITSETPIDFIDTSEHKDEKLHQITDLYTYFFMKNCIRKYYNSQNMNSISFSIDEIYVQNIDSNKNIYLIYFRQEAGESSNLKSALAIKLDKENKKFIIYTYEYLQSKDYVGLKENDSIFVEDTEGKYEDTYDEEVINTDNEAYVKGLFERFKFDLKFDLEKLYLDIDEEYKSERFETFEKFSQFINENKEERKNDAFTKYQVEEYSDYTEYTIICTNDNHYIFNTKNIMDYSLLFDNYTTTIPKYLDAYNKNLPVVQAKYCINRVKSAINDKNYEFIYDKLSVVQRKNVYPSYSEFETFIKKNFYEKNEFEFEDYMIITPLLYQYKVKVTDATGKAIPFRRFDMAVILKDDADFEISIGK